MLKTMEFTHRLQRYGDMNMMVRGMKDAGRRSSHAEMKCNFLFMISFGLDSC